MRTERHRLLTIAGQCLSALRADATVSGDARDRYGSALARLCCLARDEDGERLLDEPVVRRRAYLYLAVRQAVGTLVGVGVPWTDVYRVLADVVAGWEEERDARCAGGRADAIVQTLALPVDHYLLYEVARTHLAALADTVPATNLTDYWYALQLLDSLYDPMCRPSADEPVTRIKSVHYAAARAAITALCAFDLDNRVVLTIRDVLDREWEHDGGASRSALGRA